MKLFAISLIFALNIPSAFAQWPWLEKFKKPLEVPELLEGTEFDLTVMESEKEFFRYWKTPTLGINGDYLGPTLVFNKGDSIRLNVTNQMRDVTTMHWHGLHVAPKNDGGPRLMIEPGETYSPSFKVRDEASTYWYHPHPHQKTGHQVTMGLSGMIIVRDDKESALDLPRTYGVDDIPLIIQSKAFNFFNKKIIELGSETHFMVNGVIYPVSEMPAQWVRLRVLNASNLRVINVGFSDDRSFYMIGSDGGLLEEPVELKRKELSTGERAEILVNLSDLEPGNHERLFLVNYSLEQRPGTPGTYFTAAPNILDSRNIKVMEIKTTAPVQGAIDDIPRSLTDPWPVWNEEDTDERRRLTFEVDFIKLITSGFIKGFSIDNQLFDMEVINYVINRGDIETWEIYNNTPFGHPFHVHDVQFYILDRDGQDPPPEEQGRKDVVYVHGFETVRIIMKFEDFVDPDIPYMYHCHILSHEDEGMMGQFIVIEPEEEGERKKFEFVDLSAYPNPTSDILNVKLDESFKSQGPLKLLLHNLLGEQVLPAININHARERIDIGTLASGMYTISIMDGSELAGSLRIVKK